MVHLKLLRKIENEGAVLMAVTNEKIIRKMMRELTQALEAETDHKALVQHVSNVQLLCDLIIEDGPSEKIKTEITAEEMKAMIGESKPKGKQIHAPAIDHEEANGSSILDF